MTCIAARMGYICPETSTKNSRKVFVRVSGNQMLPLLPLSIWFSKSLYTSNSPFKHLSDRKCFSTFSRYRPLLLLLSISISVTSAVPNVGIQKDFAPQFPHEGYQPYSGIITSGDISIPEDKSKMSDAQFINLAKVAYDKMIVL